MTGHKIDDLPAGAVIEAVEPLGYRVLLPDGSRKFVSVVPGEPIAVVKTIFPPDGEIEISVGKATKETQ